MGMNINRSRIDEHVYPEVQQELDIRSSKVVGVRKLGSCDESLKSISLKLFGVKDSIERCCRRRK